MECMTPEKGTKVEFKTSNNTMSVLSLKGVLASTIVLHSDAFVHCDQSID
jgi:hypothetical protein